MDYEGYHGENDQDVGTFGVVNDSGRFFFGLITGEKMASGEITSSQPGMIPAMKFRTAIGNKFFVWGEGATALGYNTKAGESGSVAVGYNATAEGHETIAIGHDALVNNWDYVGGIAIGHKAHGEGHNTLAIGVGSLAKGENALSIGHSANAKSKETIAIGLESKVENERSIAIGKKAYSKFQENIAIGTESFADWEGAVAYGSYSKAAQKGAVALGYRAKVEQDGSIAVGRDSITGGPQATAIGDGAKAKGKDAVTLGAFSISVGEQAVTLGARSSAREQAAAIGSNVYAFAKGSVAIGGDDAGQGSEFTDKMPEDMIKKIFSNLWNENISDRPFANYGAYHYYYVGNGSKRSWSPTYTGGAGAVAIGVRSVAAQDGSTAIGAIALSMGKHSTAVGTRAYVSDTAMGGLSVGEETRVLSEYGVAVGNKSYAGERGSVAYGYSSKAAGAGSVAIGRYVGANAKLTESSMKDISSVLKSRVDTTVEDKYKAYDTIEKRLQYLSENPATYEEDTKRLIREYNSGGKDLKEYGIAQAEENGTATNNAVVVGRNSYATGNNSLILGSMSMALGKNSMSIGPLTYSEGENSAAIGMEAIARGRNSMAMGVKSYANAENAMAIGIDTRADKAYGMALGSLSITDRDSNEVGYFYGITDAFKNDDSKKGEIKKEDGKTEPTVKKATFNAKDVTTGENVRKHIYEGLKDEVLTGNASAISVGRIENGEIKPITRQITNVAAGTRDSDAVNVAQLRNINLIVKADKGTNNGTSDVLLDKHYLKVSGEDLLSTELNDENGNITLKVKAKTAKVTSNADGSYKIDGEDGFVKASDLANKLNKDKEDRDKLRNELKNINYVNKDGDKLKKDDDGNFYKVKPDGTIDKTDGPQDPLAQIGGGEGIPLTAPKGVFKEQDKLGLGMAETIVESKVADGTDIKKLGWIVNVNGDKYTEAVKQRNQVSFVDGDLVHVKGSTVNDVRQISFSISPDEVSDAVKKEFDRKGHTPVKYVDKDGKPLVKNPNDGKFYYPKSDTDLTPDESKGEQTPKILVGDKDKDPVEMTNVAPGAKTIATDGPKKGLADLGKDAKPTNVATIADLQNMGFVVAVKDNYNAQVKNAHTLKFVGEGIAQVSGSTDKDVHTITVKVNEQKISDDIEKSRKESGESPLVYVDDQGNPLLKVGDKFYPIKDGKADMNAEPKEPVGVKLQKELPIQNVGRGTGDIKEDGPTKGLADLNNAKDGNVMTVADAKNLGFVIKGKTSENEDITSQIRNADIVEFAGEDLAKVTTSVENGTTKITVKVNKDDITKAVNAENAKNGTNPFKFVDKDGNKLVKDGDKFYKMNDDGTPDKTQEATPAKVALDGKDKDNKPLSIGNVGRGTEDIKAPTDPNASAADKAKEGLADFGDTAKDDNVATVGDLKKMGFVIAGKDDDGKDVAGKVKNADTVEFEGEGLAKVTTKTENGKHKITVKVDENKVKDAVNKAKEESGEAPLKYTDDKGTPLTKIDGKYYPSEKKLAKGKDGKIYKASDLKDDGEPKDANVKPIEEVAAPSGVQLIGKDKDNKPLALSNIGDNLKEIKPEDKKATAPTAEELQKIGNNAATINDVMNTGWNLKVNGEDTKVVKPFDTVEFVNGANTTVVADKDGKLQVNVAGLPMAYTDKDGAPLAKVGDKYYALKDDGTPDTDKEATPAGVGLMNPKAEKGKTGDPVALKNVAPGRLASDSTDAVNGSQLFRTEQKVARLGGQINEVGAGAAALAALHPLDFDPDEKLDFSVGYGNYKGEHAAAIGAHYRPNEDTMVSVGGSFGGGDNMVNAGVSFRFGQKNHVSNTRIEMAKEMIAMKEHILKLEAIISRLEGTSAREDRSMDLFPDVPANHWAYEYIKGLQEKGIIEGYPNGNFDGDRHMTRYEMAAMIYRALMKGAQIEDRLLTEFAPELGRIRIDVISQDKNGKPTIERVRGNK